MQVDPDKPKLKAPGPEHLKLIYNKMLSTFAFKFNLRRHMEKAIPKFIMLAKNGEAVQVHPMNPKLKLPGTKHLKLKCDALLSTYAFKFNLRRYRTGCPSPSTVGRCRLTLSNPR